MSHPHLLPFTLAAALVPALAWAAAHGVVVDQTGAPVAGASVRVADAAPPCETTTAAAGTFSLECAEAGDTLSVASPGFTTLEVAVGAAPLRLTLVPASYTEAVVVTASRAEAVTTSAAAPVSVLTSTDLALAPPAPLDDALRIVPGFSLFRRTTSRAANPTTQGAGMRGLAASGASRVLVLADGVPLNDPFGGWVYWSRVPEVLVDRVEAVRGGASDLYGADALGGVIQILTRPPRQPEARLDVGAAMHGTGRVSFEGGGARDRWEGRAAAETYTTDGYILVPEDQRGPVDTPATLRYTSARLTAGYQARPTFFARVTGDVYGEHRGNGTALQTNSTDIRQVALETGGQLGGGTWSAHLQAGDQSYDQAFSAIAADRSGETLTTRQYVPASQHGVAIGWERRWSSMDFVTGADTRDVSATNDERSFAPSGQVRATSATTGFQRTSGAYAQVTVRPAASWTASAGARGDVRQRTRDEGWLSGDSAFSPRLALAWTAAPLVTLRCSLGWAFRAPTLNERYRGFRVGNIVTQPNEDLVPETLRAVEGSVLVAPRGGALRLTVFRNDLDAAVTNVTVMTTPTLITRRRENVGGVVAWGTEIEGEYRLSPTVSVTGTAAFTRSRFVDYQPLDGLTVPQVPRWQGSVGIRGAAPAGLQLAAAVRAFGSQFEDDRNTLVLDAGSVVDVTAIRPVGRHASAYVSLENLFDTDYDVGRTPVRTIGQPFTLHAGVRLRVP